MEKQIASLLEKGPAPLEFAAGQLGIPPDALRRRIGELSALSRAVTCTGAGQISLLPFDRPLSSRRFAPSPAGAMGAHVHVLDRTASTMDEAWQRIERGAAHGTVVVAETQSSGRGRGGNTWFSPPRSGLWLSFILRPELPGDRVPFLTQAAGLAAAKAVEAATGLTPLMKWPNDLLLDGRKIAGLLTESRTTERGNLVVALGIGLDVNTMEEEFPKNLRGLATSLRVEAGLPMFREPILEALFRALDGELAVLASGDVRALDRDILSRSAILGRRVRLSEGDEQLEGEVLDQSLENGLVLHAPDGRTRVFSGPYIHSLELLP